MTQLIARAAQKMGRKLTTTEQFVSDALHWLAQRDELKIEFGPDNLKWKISYTGGFNSGSTLAFALAEAVMSMGIGE